jgi:fructose-1-phosphate kinase PfkB-like protein
VLPVNGQPFEILPPRLPSGYREGCGDAMMGAVAAAWARGLSLRESLVFGAAAGSANFLRHGLGTGRRAVVEQLRRRVTVRALEDSSSGTFPHVLRSGELGPETVP